MHLCGEQEEKNQTGGCPGLYACGTSGHGGSHSADCTEGSKQYWDQKAQQQLGKVRSDDYVAS